MPTSEDTRLSRRGAALLALGVAGVHESRSAIALGGDLPQLVAHHGHPALALLTPAIALVVYLLARRSRLVASSPWWVLGGGAVAAFLLQAVVEGTVAQQIGVGGSLRDGGWAIVPALLAIGWLASRVREAVRAGAGAITSLRAHLVLVAPPAVPGPPPARGHRAPVLARHLAGRAPPLSVA